jgi:glycerophosphoryl diester phosphodiesterase
MIVDAKVSTAGYFFNQNNHPMVVAHRGATGQFPEHTYGAYAAALHAGIDFLEIDLQLTKDLQLITSHDPCLKESSNVDKHPEFANRMGHFHFDFPYNDDYQNDWLIHDFTLAELRTLKRK